MALDALTSIVPPPQTPYETGQGKSWEDIESTLGTRLPSDYKDYISLYGSGELGGFLWIYNPFSSSRGLDFLAQIPEVLSTWRMKRAGYDMDRFPYQLYPEASGLLPWAHADTGAELFWRTAGSPEQWTIVVSEARGPEFEEFDYTMSGFLVGLLTRRLKSDILPKPSPRSSKVLFIPYGE